MNFNHLSYREVSSATCFSLMCNFIEIVYPLSDGLIFLQSSSCISDREEEDIYDLAYKYQGTAREQVHLQHQQQQQNRFAHPRMFQTSATASPRSSKPTSPAASSLAEQRSSKLSPSG